MYLYRFVIGIHFNEKMFRLQSVGGLVIDSILKLRDTEIKNDYFTKVSTSLTRENEYTISLIDDSGENIIVISPEQFVFKKKSITEGSTVNVIKAIEEFQILWKTANKIILFPASRRIGFVGEIRINERKSGDSGLQLIQAITKFNSPASCGRFHLTFEDRELTKEGKLANVDSDDFWTKHLSFYNSEIDETPEKGKINANIDVQRYFNPAKVDPLKELNAIKSRFTEEKTKFKNQLKNIGLSE